MSEQNVEKVALDDVIRVLDEMRRDKVRISVRTSARTMRENTINEVLSEAMGRIRDLSVPPALPADEDDFPSEVARALHADERADR